MVLLLDLCKPPADEQRQLTYDPGSEDSTISPVLLQRARSVAAEQQQLSQENALNYNVAVARKIGELGPITSALKDWEDATNVRPFCSRAMTRYLS